MEIEKEIHNKGIEYYEVLWTIVSAIWSDTKAVIDTVKRRFN